MSTHTHSNTRLQTPPSHHEEQSHSYAELDVSSSSLIPTPNLSSALSSYLFEVITLAAHNYKYQIPIPSTLPLPLQAQTQWDNHHVNNSNKIPMKHVGDNENENDQKNQNHCSDNGNYLHHHHHSILPPNDSDYSSSPSVSLLTSSAKYYNYLYRDSDSHSHCDSPFPFDFSVYRRPFKWVNWNSQNRKNFIFLFKKMFNFWFSTTKSQGIHQSVETLYECCLMICEDFPFNLIRNAARITSPNQNGISPSSSPLPQPLVQKLFLLFYYSEFLNLCALTFRSLDSEGKGKVDGEKFQNHIVRQMRQEKDRDISSSATSPPSMPSETTVLTIFHILQSSSPSSSSSSSSLVQFNSFCVELFLQNEMLDNLE